MWTRRNQCMKKRSQESGLKLQKYYRRGVRDGEKGDWAEEGELVRKRRSPKRSHKGGGGLRKGQGEQVNNNGVGA